MQKRENKIVRKSNELVEARYKFSIWSMRVLLKVISLIDTDDEDFKPYNVYVGDLVRDYNLKAFGDAYSLLKEGAEDMVGKTMEIPSVVGDHVEFGKVTMISSALPKMDDTKNRYIQLRFDPEIKPHLLKLKSKFLQYDIRNVLKLQSVHSVRIYELLKQYEKIGRRRFDVQELKDTLGLYDEDGKPQYPLYANFKQRVIDKAQKDLEMHTDIAFTYEEIKKGKAVSELIFHIFPNKNNRTAENAPPQPAASTTAASRQTTSTHPLFEELQPLVVKSWGVAPGVFADLVEQRSEQEIRQAVEVTKRAKKAVKVRSSIAGYFVEAVKKGYADAEVKIEKLKKEKAARDLEIKNLEEKLLDLEDIMLGQINEKVRALIEADENIREQAIERVRVEMAGYLKIRNLDLDNLTTEDFRQDTVLRAAVINNIREAHRTEFAAIEKSFSPEIEKLKKEIYRRKNI